ncbi:MAG: hypothetical protein ACK4MM_01490 [Fervidobacterium sp.]
MFIFFILFILLLFVFSKNSGHKECALKCWGMAGLLFSTKSNSVIF